MLPGAAATLMLGCLPPALLSAVAPLLPPSSTTASGVPSVLTDNGGVIAHRSGLEELSQVPSLAEQPVNNGTHHADMYKGPSGVVRGLPDLMLGLGDPFFFPPGGGSPPPDMGLFTGRTSHHR